MWIKEHRSLHSSIRTLHWKHFYHLGTKEVSTETNRRCQCTVPRNWYSTVVPIKQTPILT